MELEFIIAQIAAKGYLGVVTDFYFSCFFILFPFRFVVYFILFSCNKLFHFFRRLADPEPASLGLVLLGARSFPVAPSVRGRGGSKGGEDGQEEGPCQGYAGQVGGGG